MNQRKDRIQNRVDDFVSSARFLDHLSLVREYAPRGHLRTFHLTARRGIAPGEEITIDYAMLGGEKDHRSEWTCRCGALDCRGTIRGTDWMLPALRDRYSGHFIPFVNLKIAGIVPEASP